MRFILIIISLLITCRVWSQAEFIYDRNGKIVFDKNSNVVYDKHPQDFYIETIPQSDTTIILTPLSGFFNHALYRSTDNVSFSLLTSNFNARYVDNVSEAQIYYYRDLENHDTSHTTKACIVPGITLTGTDEIDLPMSDSIRFDMTKPFSFETWVYGEGTAGLQNATFFSCTNGTNILRFITNGSTLMFEAINTATTNELSVQTTTTATQGNIYSAIPNNSALQFIVTYDGSKNTSGVHIYCNGFEMNSIGIVNNTLTGTLNLGTSVYKIIGTTTGFQQGLFRVFRKALTAGEATTLWNDGLPLYTTAITRLVREYKFTGITKLAGIYTIPDTYTFNGTSLNTTGVEKTTKWFRGNSFDPVYITNNFLSWKLFKNRGEYHSGEASNWAWVEWANQPSRILRIGDYFYIADRMGGEHGYAMEGVIYRYNIKTNVVDRFIRLGVIREGLSDGHEFPLFAINPLNPNELIVVMENYHTGTLGDNGKNVVKAVNLDLTTVTYLTTISPPGAHWYPNITVLGNNMYIYGRGWNTRYQTSYYQSTDGGRNWNQGYKIAEFNTLWGYFVLAGNNTDTTRLISRPLVETDTRYLHKSINFMKSADAQHWYNVNKSYVRNLNDSAITLWSLHQYYEVDRETAVDAGFQVMDIKYDEKRFPWILAIQYPTIKYRLYYYNRTGWHYKVLPFNPDPTYYELLYGGIYTEYAFIQMNYKGSGKFDFFTTKRVDNYSYSMIKYEVKDTNIVENLQLLTTSGVDHIYPCSTFNPSTRNDDFLVISQQFPSNNTRYKANEFFYHYKPIADNTTYALTPLDSVTVSWTNDYATLTAVGAGINDTIEFWESRDGGLNYTRLVHAKASTYNDQTYQNCVMLFKARKISGNSISKFTVPKIYYTPLVLTTTITDAQKFVNIDFFSIPNSQPSTATKSVKWSWGDGTDTTLVSGSMTNKHHWYASNGTYYIVLTGYTNYIGSLYIQSETNISANLEKWVLPQALLALRLNSSGFGGYLTNWEIPANGISLVDLTLSSSFFTGIPRGAIDKCSSLLLGNNYLSTLEIDNFLVYFYNYLLNEKHIPKTSITINFNGTINQHPSRTDLIPLIKDYYTRFGLTATININ